MSDPQIAVQTLIIVMRAGLVICGSASSPFVLPSTLRALNTAGGVIAVVLGIAVLSDLQAAVATLITILALALLLVKRL